VIEPGATRGPGGSNLAALFPSAERINGNAQGFSSLADLEERTVDPDSFCWLIGG